MKATTTLFTLSFVSAVAAGWYELDAAQTQDGPDRKPALTRVTLDGKEVTLGIDRARVPAGGQVHLSLAMVQGQGEVRVSLQEQTASMDSRMESPARTISSQIVPIPSDGTTIALDLAGMAPAHDPLMSAGQATRYTIVVGSDTDAQHAAALPVFAYQPDAYQLTIDEPSIDGDAMTLTVHVKNLTKTALQGITLGLSSNSMSTSEAPVINTLDGGAETTVEIHGAPVEAPEGAMRLVQVYGYASYGGTAAAWAELDHESGVVTAQGSEPYDVVAAGY